MFKRRICKVKFKQVRESCLCPCIHPSLTREAKRMLKNKKKGEKKKKGKMRYAWCVVDARRGSIIRREKEKENKRRDAEVAEPYKERKLGCVHDTWVS